MRRSLRFPLAGTTALVVAVIAGSLALLLAAIVGGAMLRYADEGAAQAACMTQDPGPSALLDEATVPVGELSAWPLGLRCRYPSVAGGTVAVEPDLVLTATASMALVLMVSCGVAGAFGRERRRLARHHRVVERRSSAPKVERQAPR